MEAPALEQVQVQVQVQAWATVQMTARWTTSHRRTRTAAVPSPRTDQDGDSRR